MIDRKITLKLSLEKVAKDFGYKIDFDEYEDVYHNGYSYSDILKTQWNVPEKYEGIDRVLPLVFAEAMENCERSSIVKNSRKQAIEDLINCLEKINPGSVEYLNDNGEMISAKAGIESAQFIKEDDTIEVDILNPEHLINAILVGEGMFGPELSTDEAASLSDIEGRFHNLEKYFDIYGESKPSSDGRQIDSSDYSDEDLSQEIESGLDFLSIEDLVYSIQKLRDAGELDMDEFFKFVSDHTVFTKDQVEKKLLSKFQSEVESWKELFK